MKWLKNNWGWVVGAIVAFIIAWMVYRYATKPFKYIDVSGLTAKQVSTINTAMADIEKAGDWHDKIVAAAETAGISFRQAQEENAKWVVLNDPYWKGLAAA